ncbi:MAG TPA: hypothetical protein VFT74_05870, partial [Isosphaeraceae bacterium]|nr:hypothetical protein [Isosphaeraceae bacterium]
MSPKIPSFAAAGLTLLGLFEGSTRAHARPFEPPGRPQPAASTATQAPAESSVLLLPSGQIFEGEILEDANGFALKHHLGVMHFARRNVVGVFGSVEEVYRYKLDRLPQNDPDERLKLAIWCLGQKLDEPAREQLEATLALNPDNKQAKAMLFHLNSGDSAATDAEVKQTSLRMAEEAVSGAPRELPRRALDEIYDASRRQPVGPPIIFDLPTTVATQRYMDFGKYVHIELQNHCARCHNADTYKGSFRLIQARSRRDLQNQLLVRTNLDATLRLLNPLDLAHSELLTVAALTHPPDGRPVLGGPNHPSYRVFQTWVASLNDRGESTLRPAPAQVAGSDSEGPAFGAGRNSESAVQKASGPGFYTPPVASAGAGNPDNRFTPVAAPGVPENLNFPAPSYPGNFAQAGPSAGMPATPGLPPVPASVPPVPSGGVPAPGGVVAPAGAPPTNGAIVQLEDGSQAIYLNGQ